MRTQFRSRDKTPLSWNSSFFTVLWDAFYNYRRIENIVLSVIPLPLNDEKCWITSWLSYDSYEVDLWIVCIEKVWIILISLDFDTKMGLRVTFWRFADSLEMEKVSNEWSQSRVLCAWKQKLYTKYLHTFTCKSR